MPSSTLIELSATLLWEREVHGTAGQYPMFDAVGTGLYYSDGWGRRPAPSLRFRRLSALTGIETARWPCGSAVRCFVRLGDDLLVATDQRLVRLDAETLAERARWDGSVRHATTLAIHEGVVVAGNPVTPTITFVNLDGGRVRRKRGGPVVSILGRRAGPPIVANVAGGLAIADTDTGTIRPLHQTPPSMAAALAEDERGCWLIRGTRVRTTEHDGGVSIRPGDPGTTVEWYPLGEGAVRSLPVPAPVRTIDVAGDTLWLTPAAIPGSEQYVVIEAATGDVWQIWHPPEQAHVEAVAPSLDLVLTTTRRPGTETTVLGCHRIDR